MFSPNIFGQWTNDGSCVVTWNSCNQQIFKIPYTLHIDHFIFQICTFLANFAPLLSLKASWCDRACGRKLMQKCHSIPIPRSQVQILPILLLKMFKWKYWKKTGKISGYKIVEIFGTVIVTKCVFLCWHFALSTLTRKSDSTAIYFKLEQWRFEHF